MLQFIPVLRVSTSCLREVMVLFGHYLAADSCFVFGEGRGEGVKEVKGGGFFHQFW